jgi:hypothetical protein
MVTVSDELQLSTLHEGGGGRFFHNDATALHAVTFYTMLSLNGAIPQKNMYIHAQENCNVMHR